MNVSAKNLALLIEAYPPEQRWARAVMQDMQNRFGYIPREGMEAAASYLGTATANLYTMAPFNKACAQTKRPAYYQAFDGTPALRGSYALLG